MDMWKYLGELPDKTEYITTLIYKDRLDRLDSIYIKKRREELKEEIKRLDELVKSNKQNNGQVREILESGLKGYIRRNSEVLVSPSQNRSWIRSSVLPELKKAGCSKYSEYDILKMFEAGEIDV